MKYRPRYGLAIMAAAAWLLSACATTTNVDFREGHDFSGISTIEIRPPSQSGNQDPRVSGQLIDDRINKSIQRYLVSRGYQVDTQGAQARLSWILSTRAGLESYDSGISVGFGRFHRHSAVGIGYGFPLYEVESYDEAVLTIDITDAVSGNLLWRGSTSRRLHDGMTPEKLSDLVNRLVDDVLEHFPPG